MGVSVVLINPSTLYLCATELTEPVLIASTAMCLAGLSDLATRERLSSPGEVATFCGIPAALATLSHYEGRALCFTGATFVAVVVWRRTRSWNKVVARVDGFAGPPALAIFWWLGYNWVVFPDPLALFRGKSRCRASHRHHDVISVPVLAGFRQCRNYHLRQDRQMTAPAVGGTADWKQHLCKISDYRLDPGSWCRPAGVRAVGP